MSAAPFKTWWEKIKQRNGPSFEGDQIMYFADGQHGEYLGSRPPAIYYELGEDNYTSIGTGARRGAASAEDDPLFLCETVFRFHVWGADPDRTHEMRRALIATLWEVGNAQSYRLGSGAWNTGEVVGNGSAYVFVATLRIPITRDPEDKAAITGFTPNDYAIQQPGDETP